MNLRVFYLTRRGISDGYVISWTGLTKVINGSLPFTPSLEYSKNVEHSNIKEYETYKKM